MPPGREASLVANLEDSVIGSRPGRMRINDELRRKMKTAEHFEQRLIISGKLRRLIRHGSRAIFIRVSASV